MPRIEIKLQDFNKLFDLNAIIEISSVLLENTPLVKFI